MEHRIIIAGFGGQGVQSMGQLICSPFCEAAGLDESSWAPLPRLLLRLTWRALPKY